MKKRIVFLFAIVCISCSDIETLGNDYYYLPDYESSDIGFPYGTIVYKSNKKNHFDKIIIDSDIVEIKHNEAYIIVKQKPNREYISKRILDNLVNLNNHYISNKKDSIVNLFEVTLSLKQLNELLLEKTSKKIVDSIINKSAFNKMFINEYNYYIIEKEKDSIIGPLSSIEFNSFKSGREIELEF